MSVSEIIEYDKSGEAVRFPLARRLFLASVIILVAALSFGIGRLSVSGGRDGVRIEYDPALEQAQYGASPNANQGAPVINAVQNAGAGEVVVSKNGSRYHYLHCSGTRQINEENKIFFSSPQAAEAAGYTLAANCRPR